MEANYYVDSSSMDMATGFAALAGVMMVVWVVVMIISVIMIIAQWKLFSKAGRPGWAVLIPFYNTYTLFDIVYGNGWKFLLMLIPLFNIYVMIKLYIDLAHVYGQSTAFGIGLLFFSPIFMCILGFGGAQYVGQGFSASQQASVMNHNQSVGGMSEEDMRAALREKMNRR